MTKLSLRVISSISICWKLTSRKGNFLVAHKVMKSAFSSGLEENIAIERARLEITIWAL